MRKSLADIACGITFLVIALAFYVQLEEDSGIGYYYPMMLISITTVGGLYYLVLGICARLKEGKSKDEDPTQWKRVIWVSVTSILYALCIPVIGYWVSTAVFLAATYMGLVYREFGKTQALIRSLLFGGGFSLFVWFFFVYIMAVPTPTGILM